MLRVASIAGVLTEHTVSWVEKSPTLQWPTVHDSGTEQGAGSGRVYATSVDHCTFDSNFCQRTTNSPHAQRRELLSDAPQCWAEVGEHLVQVRQRVQDHVCTYSHTWWAPCTSSTGQLWIRIERSMSVRASSRKMVWCEATNRTRWNCGSKKMEPHCLRTLQKWLRSCLATCDKGLFWRSSSQAAFERTKDSCQDLPTWRQEPCRKLKQRNSRKKLTKPCHNRGSSWRGSWLALMWNR